MNFLLFTKKVYWWINYHTNLSLNLVFCLIFGFLSLNFWTQHTKLMLWSQRLHWFEKCYYHRWLDLRYHLWFNFVLKNITIFGWLIFRAYQLFKDDISLIFDRFIVKGLTNWLLLIQNLFISLISLHISIISQKITLKF